MPICPLPCTPFEQKLAEPAYFVKTDSKLTQMTSIWELANVYFQNLLLINNTPDNNLQPQMHICPLPSTLFKQKLAVSAYLKKKDFNLTQMTSIWELPNVYFQNLLFINNTPDNILHLKCISVHSHAHSLSKNWLSQHIFKKQILNWRKWTQFESC